MFCLRKIGADGHSGAFWTGTGWNAQGRLLAWWRTEAETEREREEILRLYPEVNCGVFRLPPADD